jgi:hypothetical protein
MVDLKGGFNDGHSLPGARRTKYEIRNARFGRDDVLHSHALTFIQPLVEPPEHDLAACFLRSSDAKQL